MPDGQKGREAASRLYCIYMRPWTLDRSTATTDVPHISMLDKIPYTWTTEHGKVTALRCFGKQPTTQHFLRRFSTTWSWYVRGNVVSEHSARLIKQSMAACCRKTTKNEDTLDEDAQDTPPQQNLPESDLALARVHAILDHMSSSEC
eukprot:10218027-Karenia_brevis.AAC.1